MHKICIRKSLIPGTLETFNFKLYAWLNWFLKLGYGVLRLNYIGSIGGTKDATESLCGKIGDADLKYCQNTVESLLKQEKTIDPQRIVVHGGSHGKCI